MTDFVLHSKVNSILKDNESNFVKAFKEFAVSLFFILGSFALCVSFYSINRF
jgi:hypothetical protein